MPDSPSPAADATNDPALPSELISRYRDGAAVLRSAICGLDPSALRARPVPGKMSSLEVVRHIVDSDQFMCDRMKRTIAIDRPLIIGVESVDYLEPLRYQDRDPELDLQLLEVQREQMAVDLEQLQGDSWSRIAIHSEIGTVTLRELLDHAVDHLESHVATIADKRAAMGL